MFTAGIGMLDSRHADKGSPAVGYVVCKVGGPAYRIGLGGGAASSRSQGTVDSALDFNAVQRGDAEMENRMNRFIRGCVDLGAKNPIISIHDQVSHLMEGSSLLTLSISVSLYLALS
jgi:phosphoribosylformylglycinamidine synthase